MELLFLPRLFLPTMCCSWFLWNSVTTVEPHGASLRNVHARSFDISQLSSAWAEMTLVQSLQESAQWVFVVKKKKKRNEMPVGKQSADPTTVLLDLHSEESSKPYGGLPPCLSYPPNIWPSQALINSVSILLEILIDFDAISHVSAKYIKHLT